MGEHERDSGAEFPKYGHVYEADLDPVIGAEIGKSRPALIVSNDLNNRYSQTVTIMPITGQPAKKAYPFEVILPKGTAGLAVDSRMKADQIRTVDKKRLHGFRGTVPRRFFPAIEKAMKVHLNMRDGPWTTTT